MNIFEIITILILSNKQHMTDLEIIDLIDTAIALAGDGGPSPFTYEEYNAIDEFLNRLRKQYKNENT